MDYPDSLANIGIETPEDKKRFDAGMQHVLNNLLTPVQGNASFLEMVLLTGTPADVNDAKADISNAIDRMSYVAGLLVLAGGSQETNRAVFDLNTLTQSAYERSIPSPSRVNPLAHYTLNAHTDRHPTASHNVYADRSQIGLLMRILITNSKESMPNGGRVTVGTFNSEVTKQFATHNGEIPTGNYVRLTVADDGQGFPATDEEHLFKPFYTTHELGAGLGLAAARGIARANGAYIDARTFGRDGAAFDVYFPTAKVEALATKQ